MIIVGVDVETTGFLEKTDVITELGAVAFEWREPGSVTKLFQLNHLVYDPGQPEQTPFIEKLTGITNQMLQVEGIPLHKALVNLYGMIMASSATHFIAHNGAFDRKFLMAAVSKFPQDHMTKVISELSWLCTLYDMVHPKEFKSRKLSHLALDYGCAVDPKKLHRASADVELMIEMVSESRVDLKALADRALQPSITVKALIPKPFGPTGDGGKGKEKAVECGFQWDGTKWKKDIKETEYEKTEKELGYKIAIV